MTIDSGKYLGVCLTSINFKSEGDNQIQGQRTAHPPPGIKDAQVTDSTSLRDVDKSQRIFPQKKINKYNIIEIFSHNSTRLLSIPWSPFIQPQLSLYLHYAYSKNFTFFPQKEICFPLFVIFNPVSSYHCFLIYKTLNNNIFHSDQACVPNNLKPLIFKLSLSSAEEPELLGPPCA